MFRVSADMMALDILSSHGSGELSEERADACGRESCKSVERAAAMSPVDEPDFIEVQLLEDHNRKADA